MASHTVALVPGDGIGPETSAAMQRVVEASGADIVWDVAEAGAHLVEEHGTPLPASTIEAVKRNKVAIKGPVATPGGHGIPQRERGVAPGARPVRVPASRAVHSGGGAAATTAWISSSSARTPKTCTRASSSKRAPRAPAS